MSVAVKAATPSNPLAYAPGLGLDTRVHWPPSQCSTSVPEPVEPTAQMLAAARAVMPLSAAKLDCGSAPGTLLQAIPFQCAISGARLPLLYWLPTAQASSGAITVT